MPRKSEISFETKKIIWDMAVKGYRDKYSAIQRHLDRVLTEQGLDDDTPGSKLIKRIINEDINELAPEVVVSKLPYHVWKLRNDYENIKRLAEGVIQTCQSETKEKPSIKSEAKDLQALLDKELSNLARQHDVTIFKKSDAIMNEEDIQLGLGIDLECSGFINPAFRSKLEEFMIYSIWWESNKFISPTLRKLCESVCNKIKEMEPFIHELFTGGSTLDGDGNKIFGLILKDTASQEQIKLLKQLSASCRMEHQNYRIAVRQLLFL